MATETKFERVTKPLVKITEMDHIVLRTRDVEESLRFYTEVLGLQAERVEQWRAGEVRFPSARLNPDTIIDFSPPTAFPTAGTTQRTRTTSAWSSITPIWKS